MQHRSDSNSSRDAATQPASTLFQQAAAAGRNSLVATEMEQLLSALGIQAAGVGAPTGASPALDLRVSLNLTREFGMVISAGAGGADAELDEANFSKDRASVYAAVELTDAADFLALFQRTLAYQKLCRQALPDAQLLACFAQLLALAKEFSPGNLAAPLVLHSLELNPLHCGERLFAQAANCSFGAPPAVRHARPLQKIDKLLHPKSIGIIGVSGSSMNFGRIILRNLMGSGYPKQQLLILRPAETEIDGVRCVESIKALEHKLDLLIVAVAANVVYGLVDEIIASQMVESVMLIPGSLGETRKSREPAAAMVARINAAHGSIADGGPIFIGANCLGVVSHPGGYDSWFIPLERLPKPQKKPERNSVLISQSGAFMISRLSQNPWLDPRYMMALGNQTDLTQGDVLSFFAERPEIETIGIYVEGFKDGDGLDFAKAARKALLNGKQVVVYKSGRSVPGVNGVMGHTASIAGGYTLFESVVRHAGAIVAEDFSAFDDLFYIAGALHQKRIGGNRLGAISGAGYEAVGMADNIHGETFSMQLGELEASTVQHIEEILVAKKLDALVEVRNPLDINPGADDEAHLKIGAAFLADPNIDAVILGLDPTAPSVRSLQESKLRPGYDISDPNSSVNQMPPVVAGSDKPFIAIVDGGTLYDPMVTGLKDQGVCVFENCARGVKALVRYCEARLYADAIRRRQAKL